jgi:hypothetical protein
MAKSMRRKQPKVGQFKLVALGAVCFLPSYREAVKAASYLHPNVLCTLINPKGVVLFANSAAREVTGLGQPLGAMLRMKRQAIRHR